MSNPIRVLYVDNDTHSLSVRAGILEDEYGFDVLTEESVPAAKDRLTEESVDCVLSDFRMPGEDGLDFLTFVRETYPALPFILFTTHDSQEVVEKAFEAGATDFFPKSLVNVSYELLVRRIEQAVRLHRTTETLVQRPLDENDSHPGGTVPSSGVGDYSPLQQPSVRSGTPAEVSQQSAQTTQTGSLEGKPLTVDAGEVAKRASSIEADPVESRTGGAGSETAPGQLSAEDVDTRQTATQPESESDRAVTVGELADALRIAIDEAVDRALDGQGGGREESQSTTDEESSAVESADTPTDGVASDREASADETDVTPDGDVPPSAESDPADHREEPSSEPTEANSQPEPAAAESDDASEQRYDDATVQNRFHDRRETLGWISSDELPSTESPSPRTTESGVRSGRGSGRAGQTRRSDAVQDRGSREGSRRGETAVEGRRGSRENAVERRRGTDETAAETPQRSGETATTSGTVETAKNTTGEHTDGGESADTEASGAETDAAASEAESPEPDTENQPDATQSEPDPTAAQDPTPTEGATAVKAEASGDGGTVVAGEGTADGGGNGGGLFDEDSGSATEDDTSADDDGFGALEDGYPDGFDPGNGDSVLVQCGSQDQRKHDICVDLCARGDTKRSVLLVRYRQLDDDQLRRIVTDAARVKIISLGYSQPVPDDLQDSVEQVSINNPNDVTRIGTVITATLDDWDGEVALCYDPVDGLLRYKSTERAFRFLHILIGRLRSAGAISHFHADPLSSDPQEINTLKPLYDATVNVDSMGTHLE